MSTPVEKYSQIKPMPGQGKRVMKAKLLTALGATGVLRPYIQNTERTIERKILLQNAFNTNPSSPAGGGLLNGLVSYWKYDVDFSDSKDANTWVSNGGTAGNAGGIINGDFHSDGAGHGALLNPAPANLKLGTGASFTVSLWLNINNFVGGALQAVMAQYDNTVAGSSFACAVNGTSHALFVNGYETDSNQIGLTIVNPITNSVWHHVVFGYDSPNKQLFAYFDNGAKLTQATTADLNNVATQYSIGNGIGLNDLLGAIDEHGFWNRVLSASDVSNLFNGGLALPFSSFT